MPGLQIQTPHTRIPPQLRFISKHNPMLNWAITFLVIALIAAVLGFGGIAGTAVGLAKILFFVFLVLFVISFLIGRGAPRV